MKWLMLLSAIVIVAVTTFYLLELTGMEVFAALPFVAGCWLIVLVQRLERKDSEAGMRSATGE
ncbi:hypothetical protein P1X14_01355 [Sphingomonas sp. AOB5]|uniref:hypothetical protein n=1 Tax=Sphingomonas sp. AOB5 TaxID=3034017 RepID=UPI0023F82CD5|nr:hypothetical protein [Sphingomonas sp. AOB5]MDF7773878.1 hypothetical protein [Sphingomonas sp. AOB5]